MTFVDTHTHLFLDHFDNDIDEVIKRATNNGVTKLFNPNIDSTTINALLALAGKYPDIIFPLIGLHPSSAKKNFEEELEIVEDQLTKNKYWGIGEIGVDLHWKENISNKKYQLAAFEYQVKLAKRKKLPIVIHARESLNEIFEIIDRHNDNNLFGIFHCFSGTQQQAEKIIDYQGFKLGIGGVLTYKNCFLRDFLKKIDLKNIVLETDSPFLSPKPYRGKRNESSYIINVAKYLSEIYEVEIDDIAKITTQNAYNIFNIK